MYVTGQKIGRDAKLLEAVGAARREVDQDHPWIPGWAFVADDRLKPLLLEFFDSVLSPRSCGDGDAECPPSCTCKIVF